MATIQVIQKNKEKIFRGINLEKLKELELREFAKLVKSRSRRSILRNDDVINKFIKKCEIRTASGGQIKTHDREMIIVPKMVGLSIFVHNGKEFQKVDITEFMLGHRFGEFSMTRKVAKHSKLGKKK